MPYSLRPGISFCETGGRFVFLDVERDRYFCLGAEAQAAFARLIRTQPLPIDDSILTNLVERQILTRSATSGNSRACAPVEAPTSSLLDTKTTAAPLKVGGALVDLASASLRLKWMGLARVVAWIGDAKTRAREPRGPPPVVLQATAAEFQKATTLVSSPDKCLLRSVAVASRSIARGIKVELIFGVRLGPFQAHCWVQYGSVLVNDRLDVVRTFTPILVL